MVWFEAIYMFYCDSSLKESVCEASVKENSFVPVMVTSFLDSWRSLLVACQSVCVMYDDDDDNGVHQWVCQEFNFVVVFSAELENKVDSKLGE